MKQPKLFFVLMLLLVRLGAYAENEVYTVFDQTKGEMTYYYDENRAANTALPNTIVEVYNPKLTRFKEYHDQIKTVKFNSTMQNAPLTSTKYLFCGGFEDGTYYSLTELTSVDDINNIPRPQFAPYLTPRGMVFTYQQYEIAAYAAGLPSFIVPYEKISSFLKKP